MKRTVWVLTAILWAATATAATPPRGFVALNEHYEPIRLALLHDTMEGVDLHASALEKIAREFATPQENSKAPALGDDISECLGVLKEIAQHAEILKNAKSLASARDAFGHLSRSMVQYRNMVPEERPMVVYCSMAKQVWLQPPGEIGNPYFGNAMARCGEIVSKD